MNAWLLALVAALAIAILGFIFEKPREAAWHAVKPKVHKVWWRLFLRRRECVDLAILRIAAELAQRRCDQEGNPDDEYYSDWYRWFTGDTDANVDYSRKQERDLQRPREGVYSMR